jgi:hypothetical protein
VRQKQRPQQRPKALPNFQFAWSEEPVIEVEQTVYAAYQPIFGDEETPSTSQAAAEATAKTALPEHSLTPSLNSQLGDSLVHYFAPETAESLDEYRLKATPVDELDLAPAPPKPILIEEEPETALPQLQSWFFSTKTNPP